MGPHISPPPICRLGPSALSFLTSPGQFCWWSRRLCNNSQKQWSFWGHFLYTGSVSRNRDSDFVLSQGMWPKFMMWCIKWGGRSSLYHGQQSFSLRENIRDAAPVLEVDCPSRNHPKEICLLPLGKRLSGIKKGEKLSILKRTTSKHKSLN